MENCNVNDSNLGTYAQENQQLADFVLQEYIYKDFSVNTPVDKKMKNLELIISPRCNLGCRYCYIHRHRKDIFGEECFNEEATVNNLKLILQWMEKNQFNPNIEIFSGELLAQEIGYKVLDIIYEHFSQTDEVLRPRTITIPTNYTFLCSEEATARVEAIREKMNSIGIMLCLSASFDGKYMEDNRPYLKDMDIDLGGGLRDDAYYERVFEYTARTMGGLHPMLYSRGMENWPKNFDWFQEMMAKYDIPWEAIYLLHVRNEEWTAEQIQASNDFIRHLYAFVWEKVEHDPARLVAFILKGNGFNVLAQPFTSCGRGLTCGIQSQFTIRVSDMMMYPCHRLGYKDFWFGKMIPDEENVLRYENYNAELLIATYSLDKKGMPLCSQCPINHLCSGACLGAQYEASQNFMAPIPSICALVHATFITGIECLKKYGAFDIMLEQTDEEKRIQLQYLEEMVNVSEY